MRIQALALGSRINRDNLKMGSECVNLLPK